MQEQGIPSHWQNYITVDDVDALVDKVKALGGTVLAEPFDVFDSGRMMAIQDPTGAMVNFWQAGTHIGAGLVNTVGAMSWNELMTSDVENAKTFYADLLGWTYIKVEGMDYWQIMNGERGNGGIYPLPMDNIPPSWIVLLSVADIDAAAARVKELGGSLVMDIIEAQGVGRMVPIIDSTGAHLTIIQLNQPQSWEE